MDLQLQAQNLISHNPGITKDELYRTLTAHLSFDKMINHCDERITPMDREKIEAAILDAYAVI